MIKKALSALVLLLLVGLGTLTWAELVPSAASEAVPTLDQLEARKRMVEDASDLSEDQRRRLLEIYDQTLGYHQQLRQTNAEAEALKNLLYAAADRIVSLREQAQQPPSALVLEPEAESSLEVLETFISAREEWLAVARDSLRSAERELARLIGGSAALGERIASRTTAIDQIQRELAALPADSTDLAHRARVDNLRVRKAFNQAALALRQHELANLGELTALNQAIRDSSNRTIAGLQAELEQLRERGQQVREAIAREAVEQADRLRDDAARLPPEVLALADQNRELRAEQANLVAQEQSVAAALQRARQERDEYRADFERIRNRVEVVGRSEAIAKVLHARRAALPSLQTYRSERMTLESAIRAAIERQLNVDDLLMAAPILRIRFHDVLSGAADTADVETSEQLRSETDRLLDAYAESLNELQQGYARHLNSLTNLDVAVRERFDVAQQYVEYIEEQLLWMPNTNLAALVAVDYPDWTRWALDPGTWVPIAGGWLDFTARHWMSILLVLILLHALRRFNRSARRRLEYIDQALNRVKTDSSRRTLEAVFLAALRVLPGPLALFLVGKAMQGFVDPLAVAIGDGLVNASLLLGYLLFVVQLIRPNGIGARHLRWSPRACAALERPLRGFTTFFTSAVFVITLLGASEAPAAAQAVGSIVFASVMGAIFIMVRKLFGEQGAMRACIREDFAGTWAHQLHFLWYPLALATPLALGLASLGGYYYTAMHFTGRILMTVSFIFVVFVVTGVILRWLYVTERRLRYEDAIRRRDQLRAQRAESGSDDKSGEDAGDVIVVETPEVNYESLSEQSRRLVHTGFLFAVLFGTWGIWANLIPALGFLEATNLPFETTRLVDGVSTVMPITLADLVIGLFIVIVTFLAAKNLPGILELSLLQRLPLDPGARYAITALSQYLIAGIGLIIAVQTIGFQWSGLQWLIAALGVGLGFGLQEIVANFVSGIILLFERPIRVGDVVTIDGTTGVVTRIQIRATTITNYDKQELIVPNKEFITGRLINWTLSDKLNRILIPVGLAYGEDADKALNLMREAAVEIPEVLDDPAPAVSFESFGDDALMLYLRAYLANMDNRLATITALHRGIYNKFNAAGLSIAFLQRDVHLDLKHPLDIRLRRAGPRDTEREASTGDSA
ncbi:mechanosensitive ion channel domain-containing protein [Azoarcus taiwanensis]|uniref:Mechanosensitive ion channel n=1 Tax=Azoarcus taiwanensis TaxID=666964 RepID=A0A972JA61_9RHOO|nr:mechanosensitive ion channel domain-containing protein [Azoarcus taiwanensis]NMG02092.1 mechanosensitive ion channel [Azoarcus taiwanensis]